MPIWEGGTWSTSSLPKLNQQCTQDIELRKWMATPPKRFGVTRTMFRGDALALCTSSAAALSYLKRDTSTVAVFNASSHCAATQSKHCIGRGEEEKLSGALVGDKST